MRRPILLLLTTLMALVPLATGGSVDERQAQTTYFTAGVVGVYAGDDDAVSATVGSQGFAGFFFEPGESHVAIEVADASGMPMGGDWSLYGLQGEETYFATGRYCVDMLLDLPDIPGDYQWFILVELPSAELVDGCTFMPVQSTTGTVTARFT